MTTETTTTETKSKPQKRGAPKRPAKPPALMTPIDQSFALLQLAIERDATPEKIHALMDMRRELQAELAARKYREAKAAFLSALPIIKKTKKASFHSKNGGGLVEYFYASLEDITESIKPYLEEFGFSYHWEQTVCQDGTIAETCVLTHVDGHSERRSMGGMLDTTGAKNPIQMLASSSTYFRRYTLTGVLGIATADEDIDGRLPVGGSGSLTLDGILAEDDDEAAIISDYIMAASSKAELDAAGQMIAPLPEGAIKETLKNEWFDAKKRLSREVVNG